MKNIILTSILMLFTVRSFSQVHKIEVYNDDTNTYMYTESKIIEKVSSEEKTLSFQRDYSSIEFGEDVKNKNFIIQDDILLTFHIEKLCLFCSNKEKEFSSMPWRLECEYFDLKDKSYELKGYLSSKFAFLNIPNSKEIIYTKGKIHFDFIHLEDKVVLMLQADDKLYLYECIGRLMDNEWKLLNTLSVSAPLGYFQATVNEKEITLYADNGGEYLINDQLDKIQKVANKKKRKSRVVIYNHTTQEYDFVSQSKGKRIVKKHSKNTNHEK